MKTETALWILASHLIIALLSWVQLQSSMRRVRGDRAFRREDAWALVFSMFAALMRTIAAFSIAVDALFMQVTAAILGGALATSGFLIVFNQGFFLPTKPQVVAFNCGIAITLFWEYSNRVAYEDDLLSPFS